MGIKHDIIIDNHTEISKLNDYIAIIRRQMTQKALLKSDLNDDSTFQKATSFKKSNVIKTIHF